MLKKLKVYAGPTHPHAAQQPQPLDLAPIAKRERRKQESELPKPLIQTTGRRKEAVARVRIRPGTGTITVNKRPIEDYFPSETHRMIVTEPLRLTTTDETTTSTPPSTAAASPARPAPCASASPGPSSSSTPSCATA